MEDKIYKAILVKTPSDNPDHDGLFETNYGKIIFRDGKWLLNEADSLIAKEIYWYKRVTKKEYLAQLQLHKIIAK